MFRPKDINIHAGVGKPEIKKYYMFNEPALNTFDENLAYKRHGLNDYKIIDIIKIKKQPLSTILDIYIKCNQTIDFMSIDCEGYDLEVLKSNNWNKYRPNVLLVEIIPSNSIIEINNHEITKFLESQNYTLFSKLFNTCIFFENQFKKHYQS